MKVVALLLAGISAAAEPSTPEVQLAAGGVVCSAVPVYRNLVLTSAQCLDRLAPQGAALDHVRVVSGASVGRARKELERGRPYVADYALVVVRWSSAAPTPATLRLRPIGPTEPLFEAGAAAVDGGGQVVGLLGLDGALVTTPVIVAESPRLTRFVVPDGVRSEPPFLFPGDGDWF